MKESMLSLGFNAKEQCWLEAELIELPSPSALIKGDSHKSSACSGLIQDAQVE